MTNPKWWTNEHTSAWDRVKDAMKRDWEQTKADFSSKRGTELDQHVGDTVKQAAGKQAIPAPSQPNATSKDVKPGQADQTWDRYADDYRFGTGARYQYGTDHAAWDQRLETKLKTDWDDLKTGRTWDDAKGRVRRAYDRAKN